MIEMKYRVGCSEENSFMVKYEDDQEADYKLWASKYDDLRMSWADSDEDDMFREATGRPGLVKSKLMLI